MKAVLKYRFVLYSGAVRAGKTLLAANVAIRTCIENPGCTGMIGSLTTPQLTNVVFRVFQQELGLYQNALDKAGIPIKLATIKHSKGDMKAEFWNGSHIMFQSFEKEEKIRGVTLDFAIIDEPIEVDEDIFLQLINRISGGHINNTFILLTTNPGSQSHWIYEHFFRNKTDRHYTIETTTYDNVLLPQYKEYITSLEDNLDEDWIRRFLNGKWGAYSGQIYKHFNPNKHVGNYTDEEVKETYFKPSIQYYVAGVDWGNRNPSCILTLGITESKEVYVLDEYYAKGQTSPRVAKKIAAFHKKYNYRKVYVDRTAPDIILQTHDLQVPVIKADNDVAGGIGKIRGLLENGALHIDKHCYNLIRELQAYRYEKDKMNRNPTETPVKEDDHAPDALRYGLTAFRAFIVGNRIISSIKRKMWDFD